MAPPIFSVIMPVWNRADVVHRSIQSVLKQDFRDYELIIVDDGSTDDLEKAILPYLGNKVKFYQTPHHGVGAARNFGLQVAQGDFIAYLDSDNIWYPAFLSRMHAAFTSGLEKMYAAYCMYNEYRKLPILHIPYLRKVRGEPFNFEKLLVENYIDINTFVHAQECIDIVGYWDEDLKRLVDWDYIIRVTNQYPPIFIHEVLVNYFQIFENSITKREHLEPAMTTVREKIQLIKSRKNS